MHSRAANSAVGGLIWPNFELIRVLMHIIIICKYEKDRAKNSREKVVTPFLPLYPYPLPSVEETVPSAAWLTFRSLQQFVHEFGICCPIGQ